MAKNKKSKKFEKRPKKMARKAVWLLTKLIFIALLLITGFVLSVNYGFFGKLYSSEELKGFKNETASLVYTEDNLLIGKIFAENRTNVSQKDIPQSVIDALVATEDARFFEHNGVDPWSLVRVFFKTLLLNDKRSGGGSTISQQLAKNMYGRKSFGPITMPVNKCKEAILAYRLEKAYDKKEVLNLYLNTVPFGENVYGIEAASQRYFNKGCKYLKTEEAAVLIGILKANTAYNPRLYPENAKRRRNVVLSQMEKYGYLKRLESDSLKALSIHLAYTNLRASGPANYFMVEVKKELRKILENIETKSGKKWDLEKDALIVKTTLDGGLQKAGLKAFKQHLGKMQDELRKQYKRGNSSKKLSELVDAKLKKQGLGNRAEEKRKQELFSWKGFYTDSISVRDSMAFDLSLLHAGMIAINPKNGEVKCWIGGIDFKTQPNDQIHAKRSLASTFKPILYAAALESGRSPCDYLKNDQISLEDYPNWSPQNYDHSIGGKYSMSAALSKSLNIPTVNLYLETNFEDLNYLWKKLGFSQALNNKPSTALGVSNASLLELAFAYSSFANGGYISKPSFIKSISTSDGEIIYKATSASLNEKILKSRTVEQMAYMLSKTVSSGTARSLKNIYGVKIPLAGKTGSSQNYADAWFAAYNSDLVIASRVGCSSPALHFNSGIYGSGSKLALPLVAITLKELNFNSELMDKYDSSISVDLDSLSLEYDCEDFKENAILKIWDSVINHNESEKDGAAEKKNGKKSWLQRIFKKGD